MCGGGSDDDDCEVSLKMMRRGRRGSVRACRAAEPGRNWTSRGLSGAYLGHRPGGGRGTWQQARKARRLGSSRP